MRVVFRSIVFTFLIAFLLGSCDAGDQAKEVTVSKPVSAALSAQMNRLLSAYFEVGDALARDEIKGTIEATHAMQEAVQAVNEQLMDEAVAGTWLKQKDNLIASLNAMNVLGELNDLRAMFEILTRDVYKAFTEVGMQEGRVYRQYCPMAFNNKGAYWLSKGEEINNPYFGKEMLKCGYVEEVITFSGAETN